MGVMILILEHRANDPGKLEKAIWFPFGSLVFAENGSFVKEILIKRLDFNILRIKSYASVDQYHDALSKGCQNGGVDAVLDELPFIKIFLDKYGRTILYCHLFHHFM
ncbi:hypothetical protein DCAR_0311524 [Daucus carota subsp. sativus]|uniref:Solute-binding protein family 3/N-terminal domain-containing protein n=1 Tax=Daucus carota subsp. sativus TaxID=79200 RepID=A0A162AIJ4_DAUCS|nr:hypothetical protein DCAR_0311524 [Daucus carota subsp. sativus]